MSRKLLSGKGFFHIANSGVIITPLFGRTSIRAKGRFANNKGITSLSSRSSIKITGNLNVNENNVQLVIYDFEDFRSILGLGGTIHTSNSGGGSNTYSLSLFDLSDNRNLLRI